MEDYSIISKDERQDIGVEKLIAANGKGIFNYVPRFGKTKTALKAIVKLNKLNSNKSILVIAHNETSLEQWSAEIDAFNETIPYHDFLQDIYVTTLNKFAEHHSETTKHYNVIIYDEIHKYSTDLRFEALESKTITSNYKIGLTGSLPPSEILNRISKTICVIDTIVEKEAIMNKWISNYTEYNYAINLNEDESRKYITYSEHIALILKNFKGLHLLFKHYSFTVKDKDNMPRTLGLQFKDAYSVIQSCSNGYYDVIGKIYVYPIQLAKIIGYIKGYKNDMILDTEFNKTLFEYWSPNKILEHTTKFVKYVEKRNIILVESPTKIANTLHIAAKMMLENRTIVIFMGSINAAEKVYEKLVYLYPQKVGIYHSKIKSKYLLDEKSNIICHKNGNPKLFGATSLKKHIINEIDNNRLKILIAVDAIDEGINIPKLDACINTFGSSNPIQQIQRTARVKTLDSSTSDDDKVIIVNVYFDDFLYDGEIVKNRDKVKLAQRQIQSDTKIVQINTIENLIF